MGAIMHNLEVIKKNVPEVWAPDTTGLLCTLIKDFPATAIVVRENALGCLPDKKSYDTNLQAKLVEQFMFNRIESLTKVHSEKSHSLTFKSIYTLDAEW